MMSKNTIDNIDEIPIDQIIGNPFYAAINTQSNIGKLSLDFIEFLL